MRPSVYECGWCQDLGERCPHHEIAVSVPEPLIVVPRDALRADLQFYLFQID